MSSTFTTEFGHEYEKERGRWLRRRFLWYAGVVVAFSALMIVVSGISLGIILASDPESTTAQNSLQVGGVVIDIEPADARAGEAAAEEGGGLLPPGEVRSTRLTQTTLATVAVMASALLYIIAFRRVRRSEMERGALLSLVSRLIILSGMIGIVNSILSYEALQWTAPEVYERIGNGRAAAAIGLQTVFGVMFTHFFASLFLPWTAKESLRPILPLAIVAFGVTSFYSIQRPLYIPLAIVLMFLAAVPGLAVCWLRTSRFRSKFHFKMVTRRYGEMKTELDAARQIHDAMFPAPIHDGPLRMNYVYEPMRQIGGDYLFAHRVATGSGEERGLLVVLLDVTGHGISAALTVNRLQGEIERQVSLDRLVAPGKVLSELNDYLHHTLAKHSVYATALVMRFDPDAETVVWASAGHPPGFLCTVDGKMHHLGSTTIVLGATRGEHFEAVEESLPFGRGDAVLAYTDGAIEAKNDQGRMLRIDGVEKFLAGHCRAGGQDEDVSRLMLEYVNSFRSGPAEDDSLIVEVRRPV